MDAQILAELQKLNNRMENIEMILLLTAMSTYSGGASVHDGDSALSKIEAILASKKDAIKRKMLKEYGAY